MTTFDEIVNRHNNIGLQFCISNAKLQSFFVFMAISEEIRIFSVLNMG